MPGRRLLILIFFGLSACSQEVEVGRTHITPEEGAFLATAQVTLAVPPGAVEAPLEVVASTIDAAPEGAASELVLLSPADTRFAKPALIGVPLAEASGLVDGAVTLVRLGEDGTREPLGAVQIDKVLGEVRGETAQLGQFVALRDAPLAGPVAAVPSDVGASEESTLPGSAWTESDVPAVDPVLVGTWEGGEALTGFQLRIHAATFAILQDNRQVRAGSINAGAGRIELVDAGGNTEVGYYELGREQLILRTNSGDTVWTRSDRAASGGFFEPPVAQSQAAEPLPPAAQPQAETADGTETAAETDAGGLLRGLGRRLRQVGKRAVDTVKRQGERLSGAASEQAASDPAAVTNPYSELTDNLRTTTPADACSLLSADEASGTLGGKAVATALHTTVCRYLTEAGAMLTVNTDFDAVENRGTIPRMIRLGSCTAVEIASAAGCSRNLSSGAVRLWLGRDDDVLLLELRGVADAGERLHGLAARIAGRF